MPTPARRARRRLGAPRGLHGRDASQIADCGICKDDGRVNSVPTSIQSELQTVVYDARDEAFCPHPSAWHGRRLAMGPRTSSDAEREAMQRLADAERATDRARRELEAVMQRERRRARAGPLRIVHSEPAPTRR